MPIGACILANKPLRLKGPQFLYSYEYFCWGCPPACSKRNPNRPAHEHSSANNSRFVFLNFMSSEKVIQNLRDSQMGWLHDGRRRLLSGELPLRGAA